MLDRAVKVFRVLATYLFFWLIVGRLLLIVCFHFLIFYNLDIKVINLESPQSTNLQILKYRNLIQAKYLKISTFFDSLIVRSYN